MDHRMTPSWRKPVGMLLILLLILIWVIGVASLSRIVGGWPMLAQLGFYLVTGIAWLWLLPMRRLLQWMETGTWR
jgi:membrane protein YdbS with pleckstrin-like domain